MFRRPSAALVVAAVAIFLSTTGTALAAIIISDNSQVAAHTIAGAQAPSGDNQNIIPGTIGTKDLADASVASTKLGDDARTHKIQFLAFAFSAKVLAQVGHMTFGATCEPNVPSAGQVTLLLNVGNSDPHAFADISWSYLRSAGTGTVAAAPYANAEVLGVNASDNLPNLVSSQAPPASVRDDGHIVFNDRSDSEVITLVFHADASVDRTGGGAECEVYGDAVEALKK